MNKKRCGWANPANPLYLDYHDHHWGVPCHDETTLFEMLNLEGAQAGLSWETTDWPLTAGMGQKSPAMATTRLLNYWPIPASCATV